MKLVITTPLLVEVNVSDVNYLSAEDETGLFGILPGHADFLTALTVSVVTWRDAGAEHYAAVRGGMLSVEQGSSISIATPDAVISDDLGHLESHVLARFRERHEQEQIARVDLQRLYLSAMRRIYRYLRPEQSRSAPTRSVDAEVANYDARTQ